MTVLLGFDPGGKNSFGWCVTEDSPSFPLRVRGTGVADDTPSAIEAAQGLIENCEEIVAIGIDAPLFWVTTGDRGVDLIVRQEVRRLGAPSPGGTVQAVNSLRGACLVQGMLTGVLLRKALLETPITESHPKALLWQLGIATSDCHPTRITLQMLPQFSGAILTSETDHGRDAAISTLCAWAMLHEPKDWQNLYLLEDKEPYSLIAAPLGYWMPQVIHGHHKLDH